MIRPRPQPAVTSRTEQSHTAYWRFYDAVADAQVTAWAPNEPKTILDLSGSGGRFATMLAARGHHVVHVLGEDPPYTGVPGVVSVAADPLRLDWLAPGSLDAVLAEGGALSTHLATETAFDHVRRVLRPGGRLLLSVDSLVHGLARLAEQSRWAELADVPSADVVLVPNEDGSITRCFWPEDLLQTMTDAGFDVEWIRPRTVLSKETVDHALEQEPGTLRTLVQTELALAREREGEPVGMHLVAAVRRCRG